MERAGRAAGTPAFIYNLLTFDLLFAMTNKDLFDINRQWMDSEMRGLTPEEQAECVKNTLKYGCGLNLLAVIVLLLFLMIFGSCTTTQYVPVIETRTDTTYIVKTLRDSVMVHDSLTVRERGDTVIIDRWHIQYRERIQTDTVEVLRTNSVPRPYPVTEFVEKPLTWWQATRMHVGEALILLLLGWGLWKVVKRKFMC